MKRLTTTIVLVTSLFSTSLFAGERHATEATNKAYIAGFLAGAQLTDREIINRLEDASKNQQASDFFQRAYKTRVGERSTPPPATYYAGFCLPNDTINASVIENILAELGNTGAKTSIDQASAVFTAIQKKYPC